MSAACFSGRTTVPVATAFRQNSQRGSQRRQQQGHGGSIRSSLEEEFKKQCLGRANGSSSSNPERLKDLSASRFGGSAGDAAGSLQQPAPDSANRDDSPPFAPQLPSPSEGYHPLEFYPTSHVELDWGPGAAGDEHWAGAADRSRCFVLLFGVGRAETEGIYSLRASAKEDDDVPVDTIVAFENENDAMRYSTLLEATMDHEPTVWPIDWGELLEFCNSAGYRCRLEPAGSLLIPPDFNVPQTDWEKSLRLRNGEFSVLGGEPAPRRLGEGLLLEGAAWALEAAMMRGGDEALNTIIDSQLSSPAALEAMRASLERLLPRD